MSRPGALLLTPGAGGDRDHPTLVAIADAVAPLPVARVDFPYRAAGRRAPDRAPVAIAHVRAAAAALAGEAHIRARRLVLGGRSYGGRMCSLAVAEGLEARGLVLLSYPLHPPGRPQQRRTEHFPAIDVPCLFVTGPKDPFGTPAELRRATRRIDAEVTHVVLPSGGHDPVAHSVAIASAVAEWLASLR